MKTRKQLGYLFFMSKRKLEAKDRQIEYMKELYIDAVEELTTTAISMGFAHAEDGYMQIVKEQMEQGLKIAGCDHEWTTVNNETVIGCTMCFKCGKIKDIEDEE